MPQIHYKPMSAPVNTDLDNWSLNSITSPKPKLTPWPASGCILWAASL